MEYGIGFQMMNLILKIHCTYIMPIYLYCLCYWANIKQNIIKRVLYSRYVIGISSRTSNFYVSHILLYNTFKVTLKISMPSEMNEDTICSSFHSHSLFLDAIYFLLYFYFASAAESWFSSLALDFYFILLNLWIFLFFVILFIFYANCVWLLFHLRY